MNKSGYQVGAARSPSHLSFRKTPVALAIGLALLGSHAALAEEASKPAADSSLEEITVTGSRIKLAVGMTTPVPVAALSVTELQALAPSSITEALVQMPQYFNSSTAENFGGAGGGFFTSPGGGSLNLRGLGQQRTLTLLDGRRMTPATAYGGPDINMFPDQLVKRIDTVTGGVSAQYGTDAVAGVVNYLLDTDYEGIRGSAQYGESGRGDGQNEKYTFAIGHALTDKAHILFSAAHFKQEAINQTGDRDWYQGCGLMTNPAVTTGTGGTGGTGPAYPLLIPACGLHSTRQSFDGVLNPSGSAPFGSWTFDSSGTTMPFARGSLVSRDGNLQVGGSGNDYNDALNVILPGTERSNAFLYTDYDVTDHLNVYLQGVYGEQKLERAGLIGGFGGAPQFFTIYQDNAFLPASLRTRMQANNIQSLVFQRQGSPKDLGIGSYNNNSKMMSGTMGFKSSIASDGYFNGWDIDGYFQYGTSKLDAEQVNGVRVDRIFMAVDAITDSTTGQVRCRVSPTAVPGCVPLNLFGEGRASAAAVDWVTGFDPGTAVTTNGFLGVTPAGQSVYGPTYSYVGDADKHRLATLNQRVAEITATGNLFDGWAGAISTAVGANYRREAIYQKVQAPAGNPAADPNVFPVLCNDADVAASPACRWQVSTGRRPATAIGIKGVPGNVETNTVEFQFSKVPFIRGHYDIKELFNETIIPLISDQPWMKRMALDAAVRWADYAGSGSVWSYRFGLEAQVNDEVRLRGVYSRDTRAANVSERFDRTGGAANITDKYTPAPGGLPIETAPYTVTTVSGGNPDVDPEKGDTYSFGVVYRPEWLSGFDMSIDWSSIKLNGAISSLTAQQIIDECYLKNNADQCARITRGTATTSAGTRDVITFVNALTQNLSKATWKGVDIELGYTHGVTLLGGNERMGVRVFGTWTQEASTTNFFGVKTDNTGSVPLQNFTKKVSAQFSYTNGPFRWNLSGRYNNGGLMSTNYNLPGGPTSANPGVVTWNVADNTIGGSVYWDTRVGYDFSIGDGTLEVFGNVQNLFDRDPSLVYGEGVGLQTASAYDQIGRRFVIGVNMRF